EIVSTAPALPAREDPLPILPIRLWEHGALLFAATTPSDPDQRLGLLEQGAGGGWQWLPLVGADFPLLTYAQRGPLVAWTPHLARVALKLERKPSQRLAGRRGRRRRLPQAVLPAAIFLHLGANLWATYTLSRRLPLSPGPPAAVESSAQASRPPMDTGHGEREQFAQALHGLLQSQAGTLEWSPNQ